jgi:CII-binding regulator of phage lambda lysogenization HflD
MEESVVALQSQLKHSRDRVYRRAFALLASERELKKQRSDMKVLSDELDRWRKDHAVQPLK